MLIYLVRHGQTQGNVDGICSGISETPLTKLGIQQAQATSQVLSPITFDAVFSSDLSRAHDTAAYIIGSEDGIIKNPLLRERNYHEFEGVHGKVLDQCAIDEGFSSTITFVEGGGNRSTGKIVESNYEMIQRREQFYEKYITCGDGQTILIASHGSFIRSIIAHILQLDLSIGGMNHYIAPLQNTGISIVEYTPEKGIRLITYNQHLHLLNLI